MRRFIQRLLVFLMVGVGIMAGIEITARIIGFPKKPLFNIQPKGQNLIPRINERSILLLGDSRIEWGIKPQSFLEGIQSNQNLNVINLAFTDSNGLDILQYLKDREIHPFLIIIGYSPQACWYKNHGFDTAEFSLSKRWYRNIRYYFKSTFLISDNSIYDYFRRGPLTIKSLKYGKWGGVWPTLNTDYSTAKQRQIQMYRSWAGKITEEKLEAHKEKLNAFIHYFQKNQTKVFGVHMPVEPEILDLEDDIPIPEDIAWDQLFDYTHYLSDRADPSEYFLDGSHLNPVYSHQFSKMFGNVISEHLTSLEVVE